MQYKCKVCGVMCEAVDMDDILRRKKLCDKHLDLSFKEQNGVIKSLDGSLRKEAHTKPKKKKTYWKCEECGEEFKYHHEFCFICHDDTTAHEAPQLVVVRK